MRIYFEDGPLIVNYTMILPPEEPDIMLDAAEGVSHCINVLDNLLRNHKDCVIYTNSIFAFSNHYAWNEKLQLPEIYIRDRNGIFTNITNFTNRILREGHNLAKLYVGGEFQPLEKETDIER